MKKGGGRSAAAIQSQRVVYLRSLLLLLRFELLRFAELLLRSPPCMWLRL